MTIHFKNNQLEKRLSSERLIKKHYNHVFKGLLSALTQLRAVDNLSLISSSPPLRRHKLIGYKSRWTVDVSKNFRLVFEAVNKITEDIKDIKEITIIDIEDTH